MSFFYYKCKGIVYIWVPEAVFLESSGGRKKSLRKGLHFLSIQYFSSHSLGIKSWGKTDPHYSTCILSLLLISVFFHFSISLYYLLLLLLLYGLFLYFVLYLCNKAFTLLSHSEVRTHCSQPL